MKTDKISKLIKESMEENEFAQIQDGVDLYCHKDDLIKFQHALRRAENVIARNAKIST
jgi:hypothetical protein